MKTNKKDVMSRKLVATAICNKLASLGNLSIFSTNDRDQTIINYVSINTYCNDA